MSDPINLMIVGATGVVGRAVLALALADARVAQVVAPTRRPLPSSPKLHNPVVDFAQLADGADWWHVDAVICTLGTTIKAAGSQTAFVTVDRDLPIQVARLARAAGATRYALNSSLGASLSGNFYLRTKAQAEADIRECNYPSFTIVRPSLIDADRDEFRAGEWLGRIAARVFRPLVPLRYRAVKPEAIASALLDGVLKAQTGMRVIESARLH